MRQFITDYLHKRLEEKLEPINKKLAREDLAEPDRSKLTQESATMRDKFCASAWLEDAAKRASQIKLATHVLKMTNPEAKGSSIYWVPKSGQLTHLLGTSSLGTAADVDVVGNAAALDIYKFLNQVFAGESLLQRALRKDAQFVQALSDDSELAQRWCDAFASLAMLDREPASHPLAKQIYWHHPDNSYTLLAPLSSSALSSAVLTRFSEERYSEAAKNARDAKNKNQRSDRPVRYYTQVVEQNMGGTKPQNISYLNSQRGGTNLLLPSLPPVWAQTSVRLPRAIPSVFGRELLFQPGIRPLLDALSRFLLSVQQRNNLHIRNKRAELTQALVDCTLEYGYRLQSQPPGWSAQSRLDIEECCWLDPGRRHADSAFPAQAATLNWRAEVCHRFGNWMNAQMSRAGLAVGDAEFGYWRDELTAEVALMAEALNALPEEPA